MLENFDPETNGESKDIVADNIEQLKQLFPEVFTEDKLDFKALQTVLGEYSETNDERYSFTWHGKAQAKRIAQTSSTGTLRPNKQDSKEWDKSNNLFIEGDNLEVLKLLQKSYHKRVKMIYIDPPYNTGREFIYPDKYQDNLETYLEYTGQKNSSGMKFSAKSETSGRYHTSWLNMIYPRLKLARNLLRDDGVIFISIDDNEQANLKKVCDEIFGEENFIGCAGRITKKSNNKGDFWAPNFDYVLTYSKNAELADPFFGGVNTDAYNLVETEGPRKGERYQLVRLYMSTIQNRNPEQRYWITCPDGSKVIPPGQTFPPERPLLGDGIWRWTKSKFEKEYDKIVIKKVSSSNLVSDQEGGQKWNVFTKTYLQDVIDNSSAKPNSFIEGHINQKGSHEIRAIEIPFDYSKPSSLIKHLIEISKTKDDDIVLDFFAGSATTADAVLQKNIEDGNNRRFIMVQLPEPCDENSEAFKAGYKTIADIGKERIRRAGEKLKSENTAKDDINNIDIGFKAFTLDSSNIKPWDADFEELESDLYSSIDNIKDDRLMDDVLYELLLKYGIDLSIPLETYNLSDKTVYSVGLGALLICLDDDITLEVVEGIGKLKEGLQPETVHVVLKDAGLKDDVVKTNAIQLLKRYDINDVKTL